MQQAKYEHNSAIRNKEKLSKELYTDELNDALMKKDTSSFWKCWKSKFSSKKVSQVIDGDCDAVIAENFAGMFKAVCSPDSAERHSSLRSQFEHTLQLMTVAYRIIFLSTWNWLIVVLIN